MNCPKKTDSCFVNNRLFHNYFAFKLILSYLNESLLLWQLFLCCSVASRPEYLSVV
jgi:hypothetical protein